MSKYFSLFLSLFFSTQILAESFIYVQNNSSLTFAVNSTQTGPHTMDSDEWWGLSGAQIEPWQLSTNVLWSNRNVGIHSNTDFFLTTTLTSGSESIDLKMYLNGNFIGSDMWQSLSGPGFGHSWFGDRNFHEQTFTLNGKTVTVKYTAYAAGTYDDILFTIQEHDPFPLLAADLVNPAVLNVLSYNIYMLSPPIALTSQSTRAAYIHEHVNGYDVLIINEAFDNAARAILTANLSAEYPYATDVVDESGSLEDGGVIIYSRWPIDYSEDIVYADCDADDCLAAKGAMYARIEKLGKKYHVFGTHTQAWPDAVNVATRQAQMAQMKAFVDAKNIPVDEPVILGGDFNVERTANYLNEYDQMFTILNTEEPVYQGHPFTYDYLVSDYADATYQEYLDYVMYEKAHQIPITQSNKVVILRSIADDMWDIFDLSDHLAIQGRFEFPFLLPFELTDFEGLVEPNNNRLFWTTASQKNSDFFEVQHSFDGVDFTPLEKIAALGNSLDFVDYEFNHRYPAGGINYYRLRLVDKDGAATYSDIIALKNETRVKLEMEVFPNPTASILNLRFQNDLEEKAVVSIYNALNQLIGRLETTDLDGVLIDVSSYPSGPYFLRLNIGSKGQALSFIKL